MTVPERGLVRALHLDPRKAPLTAQVKGRGMGTVNNAGSVLEMVQMKACRKELEMVPSKERRMEARSVQSMDPD